MVRSSVFLVKSPVFFKMIFTAQAPSEIKLNPTFWWSFPTIFFTIFHHFSPFFTIFPWFNQHFAARFFQPPRLHAWIDRRLGEEVAAQSDSRGYRRGPSAVPPGFSGSFHGSMDWFKGKSSWRIIQRLVLLVIEKVSLTWRVIPFISGL